MKRLSKPASGKYGKSRVDMRGARAKGTPNRITGSGVGLKRRLNGT